MDGAEREKVIGRIKMLSAQIQQGSFHKSTLSKYKSECSILIYRLRRDSGMYDMSRDEKRALLYYAKLVHATYGPNTVNKREWEQIVRSLELSIPPPVVDMTKTLPKRALAEISEKSLDKEVLLSQLGGKKIFVFYNDGGVDCIDDVATLLEESGSEIDSIIVVDEFREYEVVEKIKYVLEQID